MGFDFDQALDLMKRKTISDPIDWRNSWDRANREAFWVAGITSKELLIFLHESICEAIDKGEGYEAWCKRVLPKLEGKLNPNRLRTIFTTNVFTAQSAARYIQLKHFADEDTYWQYVTVDDDRVRPAHQQLHNKVFHCEDVFWDTHYPPNGFNCRCVVVSLDADEVKKRGLKIETGEGRIKWITDPKGNKRAVYTAPDGTECPTDVGWGYNPGRLDKLEDIDREKQLELEEAADKSGEAVRREPAAEPERPAAEPVKPEAEPTSPAISAQEPKKAAEPERPAAEPVKPEAEPTSPAISAQEPKKAAEPEQEKPADKTDKPKKTEEEESLDKRRRDRITTRNRDSRDQDGRIYTPDSAEPKRVKPKRSPRKRVSLDKDELPAAPKPLKTVPKSEPVPSVPAPIKPAPVSPAPAPAPPQPVPVQPEPVPVPSVPQPKPIPAPSVPAEEPDDATVPKRKRDSFNPLRLVPLLLDSDKPAEVVQVEEDEDELPQSIHVNSLDDTHNSDDLSEDAQPLNINDYVDDNGILDVRSFKQAIRNRVIEHAAITDKNGKLLVYYSGNDKTVHLDYVIAEFLKQKNYQGKLLRCPTFKEIISMVRDGVMPHSVLTGQAQEEFSKYSEGGHIIHNHHNKTPHSDGDIMSVKIAKLNSVSAVNPDNDYILDFSKIEEDNRNVIFDEIILKLKGWRIDFEKNRITKEQRDDNIREYCRNIAKKYGIIYQIGY